MDSANKEALYIKEKVNDIKHKHTTENLKAVHVQEKLKSHEYLKEASVPYQGLLKVSCKGTMGGYHKTYASRGR